MTNYQELRVKITNTQLIKWKSAAKDKTGALLKLSTMKNCHINYF